jgi:translation elongation factor P/translation initiation factor 5A
MQTKAAELAGILEEKTIFYVKIEIPNDRESIDEITLERQQGITYRIEGSRIVFTAGETTAAFELPETAEILTNRKEEAEIIVTLAENGGLQIKCRVSSNKE